MTIWLRNVFSFYLSFINLTQIYIFLKNKLSYCYLNKMCWFSSVPDHNSERMTHQSLRSVEITLRAPHSLQTEPLPPWCIALLSSPGKKVLLSNTANRKSCLNVLEIICLSTYTNKKIYYRIAYTRITLIVRTKLDNSSINAFVIGRARFV